VADPRCTHCRRKRLARRDCLGTYTDSSIRRAENHRYRIGKVLQISSLLLWLSQSSKFLYKSTRVLQLGKLYGKSLSCLSWILIQFSLLKCFRLAGSLFVFRIKVSKSLVGIFASRCTLAGSITSHFSDFDGDSSLTETRKECSAEYVSYQRPYHLYVCFWRLCYPAPLARGLKASRTAKASVF